LLIISIALFDFIFIKGWKLIAPQALEKSKTDLREDKASILDLVRNRSLLFKSLILFYNWAVNSFCYYGLTLNAHGWGDNVHLSFAINGILEIPAYAFVNIILSCENPGIRICKHNLKL
jgi:hypothetical protein